MIVHQKSARIKVLISACRGACTVNGRERVLSALKLQAPDVIPVFEWSIDAKVVMALCCSTEDAVYSDFWMQNRAGITGLTIEA